MTFGDQSRASLERSFEELNRRTGWDCTVSAFDGWRLQISSGTSEETQQPLVSFCGVSYLSCPMEFSHPTFRLASREEVERVQEAIPLVTDDKVIAIDAETMSGLARQVFFVVAQAIELGVFQCDDWFLPSGSRRSASAWGRQRYDCLGPHAATPGQKLPSASVRFEVVRCLQVRQN